MNKKPSSDSHLVKFFREMLNRSFGQLGMRDHEVVEYMAMLLAQFSRADRWLALRDAEGQRLSSVVEQLLETAASRGGHGMYGERAVRQYVGDYTLFMSGLFRAFVARRGYLDYYLEEGKRSYEAVSRLDLSLYRPGFLLFEELSRSFELYAAALDYMRKACFATAPGEDPFAGFFRQIEGWVRCGLSNN